MHSMTYVILCGFIVIGLPLAMNWIPQNRWYGFRTPATLTDPELWRRVNMFAGWALLVAALLGFIIATIWADIVDPWGPVVMAALASVATAASFVYLLTTTRNH
jgi:hypothetical protein